MLRLAASAGGELVVDRRYSAPGRGAYLCRIKSCGERARARRAIERSLKLKNSIGNQLRIELEQQ